MARRQASAPDTLCYMGTQLPLPQRGTAPNLRPISVVAKMPLGMQVGLGPGDFVLDGERRPLPKKGREAPKFSARVYCGQTARWIKMALGREVSLSPGDFV